MQRSGNNASDGGRAPRSTNSDRPSADGAGGGAARASGTQSVPPSTIDRLTIGTVVNGKYRVLSILGRGSMGIVAECEHVELRERLALKFLLTRGNVAGEDFRVRFMREAQVSAKLKGLHIARVVDVGVWLDAIPFMVMEHLEGTDLARVLRAAGRLPVDVALEYAIQICEGMAEAHALGVVHRDLKPSNVFVTHQADGTDLIKILDFGVSKWDLPDRDGEGTQAGLILGSPKYMAPEQMLTASKVDARADVWSIGALVYQMMIGRSPFDFPTFAQTFAEVVSNRPPPPMASQVPEIPAPLEGAIMRCFERTPEARYQSVAELAGALLDAVDSPYAAGTRARIESVLATRGGRDASGMQPSSSSRIRIASHTAGPVSVRGPGTTGASMATADVDPPPRLRTSRARIVAGVLAVGAIVFASLAMPAILRDGPKAEPPTARAPEVPPQAATPPSSSERPSEDTGPPPSASVSSLAEVPGSDGKVPPRAAPLHAHAAPTPRAAPVVAATTAPSTARPPEPAKRNCDPPFVLSSDGVRTYKPECF
jgi:serine/threonine protein kinase